MDYYAAVKKHEACLYDMESFPSHHCLIQTAKKKFISYSLLKYYDKLSKRPRRKLK